MAETPLSSGPTVDLGDPIRRFFSEEWAYYDGIPDTDPDHIVPVDVLATVAVNSFVSTADKVRRVHRALAEVVDPVLVRIPADADLSTRRSDCPVSHLKPSPSRRARAGRSLLHGGLAVSCRVVAARVGFGFLRGPSNARICR